MSGQEGSMQMIDVPVGDGVLRTRVMGKGPVLLFVHGALVDGKLWDPVLPHLVDRFTCVIPEMPLGSHTLPLPAHADRSPAGHARRVARLIEALSLRQVTLVGNDSGGAISQLVAADHSENIERLVLTNCDALEVFPPKAFAYLAWLARVPWTLGLVARLMNTFPSLARMPTAYGGLSQQRYDPDLLQQWLRPSLDPAVRADTAGFFLGAQSQVTLEVAERLRSFEGPILLAWGTADPFFKTELAERLVAKWPRARLVKLDARTFVSLDQPRALAALIAEHVVPSRATLTA
jgi:pimeloyl-ACP methyl ester carboxylesterase